MADPLMPVKQNNQQVGYDEMNDLVASVKTKVDKQVGKGLSTNDFDDAAEAKLSGIAPNATANDTDANLRNRANHTGQQQASSISDFVAAARGAFSAGSNITISAGGVIASTGGSGSAPTTDASQLTSGTLDAARLPASVVNLSGTQTLTNKTLTAPVINAPTGLTKADVGLPNAANADTTNAGNITSGQLALARQGTGTPAAGKYVDGGTGAWTTLPTGSGGSATTDASQLTSGTLPDARLSTNVVNLAGAQTLTNKTLTTPVINAPTGLVKSDVGLGNVDNTSDAGKPVSTATQTALNAKQATLVSGTNIKTINGTTLLGSGDIAVSSGGSTPSGTAGGSLAGTYPNPTLSPVVTAGSVGSSSAIPVLTYNNEGRITAVTTAAVTGVTYDVTSPTRDAIQAAITAAGQGKRIVLAPLNYNDLTSANALNFGGKLGVTLDGVNKGARFTSSGGVILLVNGDNTDSRITGIQFIGTATTGGAAGQILINEQGAQNGIEIDHCYFSAPQYRTNGITGSHYSVQSGGSGGSGLGKLTKKARIHTNDFDGLGRCAIELVNHSWDDSKTDVYLKDIQIYNNNFNNTGRIAETDGTTFNGMAISISGYAYDVQVSNNKIDDAKLLGIELAGTDKAIVSQNIVRSSNNIFVPISISDNGHSATKNINVANNNIQTRVVGIKLKEVQGFNVTDNDVTQIAASSDAGTVYFQDCVGGTFSGGTVVGMANNTVRLDNSSKIIIGGAMRLINKANDFPLISMYGAAGQTPGYNVVGPDITYEKNTLGVVTTDVTQQIGTQANNTFWSPVPPVVVNTTRQTITSGSSSTIANASGTIEVYINPSSTLASYAATFPSSPADNQRVTFHFGGTMTSGVVVSNFSVVANTGQTVGQATTPSSFEAFEAISYIFNPTNSIWYRSY